MSRRVLAAQVTALCFLSACSPPVVQPEATATPTHLSSAAIASADVTPLATSNGAALPAGEPTKINCTVDGTRSATWTAALADAPKVTVAVALPQTGSMKAVWQPVSFGTGWIMAIVPGDVASLDVVADLPNETGHGYSVGAGYLEAIGSTCLAIRYDVAADASKVRGLIWRSTGDVFRKDTGDAVTFVEATSNDDKLAVYSDSAFDVFGVVGVGGATTSRYQESYHPAKSKDPFPFLQFSTVVQADGRWRTFFVGVLPAGSGNVKMSFLSTATNPTLQTVNAASGEVFLVAGALTPQETGEIFDDLTYTNAAGKTVRPVWNGS